MIRGSLQDGHSRIMLVDFDTQQSYECELHRSEWQYCVERFIWHGWDEFVINKRLKRGDQLTFMLRDPPGDKLFVKTVRH